MTIIIQVNEFVVAVLHNTLLNLTSIRLKLDVGMWHKYVIRTWKWPDDGRVNLRIGALRYSKPQSSFAGIMNLSQCTFLCLNLT